MQEDSNAAGRRGPGGAGAGAVLAAAVTLLGAPGTAIAQIIDSVEVAAKGKDAEIAIRFVTTVQYVRHTPPGKGRLLAIEFRVTGPLDSDIGGRLVSEARASPPTDLVPPFEVRYVAASKSLTVEFKREVSWRVRGRSYGRAITILVPLPADKVAKTPPPRPVRPAAKPAPVPPAPGMPVPFAPAPEVRADGMASVARARAALEAGRFDEAIEVLNHALNLPPGDYSREAQELIGVAREKSGAPEKARAEYELYLKLYTDPAGVARVKERLAALGKEPPRRKPAREDAPPETSVYGSISSTYYRGATKYDATLLPPQPGLQPDQVSLTATDQSAFVTNVDLTGRYRNGPWDNRIVFRDTWTASLLSGDRNENRLSAAYYEMNHKDRDWAMRAGRQSSPGGGVLGRFDGVWARLGIRPGIRLNAVGGRTVEYYDAPRRDLFGASVDLAPAGNGFFTNIYAIEQRVDGVTDRRAVGTEMRYFDPSRNALLLVDYDMKFRELGTAMLQANWLLQSGSNLSFLYDRRRTPPLQVSNVAFAYPGQGVGSLIDSGIPYTELLDQARRSTPVSDLVSLGITHPLTQRWQAGADVKLSRVSGTEAVGQLGASPDNGNFWVYTAQAIGTGLLDVNDVFVASLSLNRGKLFDGESASLSYVRVVDRWRLEGTLKYYDQTDTTGIHLRRWTPSARAGYRVGEHLTFEGEAGAEISRSSSPVTSEDTRRHYFNLGFRWDFF